MKPDVAFVGLGMTELGKVYGRTATDFAAEAVLLALADAGLEAHDLDGIDEREHESIILQIAGRNVRIRSLRGPLTPNPSPGRRGEK